MYERPRGPRAAVNSGKFSDRNRVDQESALPKLLSTSQIWAGFAAGRAALDDSTALFIPMLEKSPNSRIGKAKGFSRFLGRMIAVLLSFVGVSETMRRSRS
jgi:hypothetical protein